MSQNIWFKADLQGVNSRATVRSFPALRTGGPGYFRSQRPQDRKRKCAGAAAAWPSEAVQRTPPLLQWECRCKVCRCGPAPRERRGARRGCTAWHSCSGQGPSSQRSPWGRDEAHTRLPRSRAVHLSRRLPGAQVTPVRADSAHSSIGREMMKCSPGSAAREW